MIDAAPALNPVNFSDLPGWEGDDHLQAWNAFVASSSAVLQAAASGASLGPARPPEGLVELCRFALSASERKPQTAPEARRLFEACFRPMRVTHSAAEGLLTGYYEPVLDGAREPDENHTIPIYRRPADLVNMVAESERGAKSDVYTHMRQTPAGLVPYATRAEITDGALAGQNLELMYFKDPVDVFFMQVQGSGRVRLPDGTLKRITYDGKNGHPYTSIGRYLIDTGAMSAAEMSLASLKSWLQADRDRGARVMAENKSYVFFRELSLGEPDSPLGTLSIPLQTGRSLAVDTAFQTLGLPIYVSSPSMAHVGASGFHRLMIAHDVGSAIKGPERGDIYFGSGDDAGRAAGITKHNGRFFVFVPNVKALAGIVSGGIA